MFSNSAGVSQVKKRKPWNLGPQEAEDANANQV